LKAPVIGPGGGDHLPADGVPRGELGGDAEMVEVRG